MEESIQHNKTNNKILTEVTLYE